MKKQLKLLLKVSISVLLLFILFYKIGIREVYKTLLTINLSYVFLLLIVFFITFVLAAIKLRILLSPIGFKNLSLKKLTLYSLYSYAIAKLVPGKFGEFSTIYFLKNSNVPLGKSAAVVLMDKIITFIVLFMFAVVGFFVFLKSALIYSLTLLAIFLIFIVIVISEKGRAFIKRYILRKYANKLKGFYKTFSYFFKRKKGILLLNFIFTIIRTVVLATIILFAFLSVDRFINFGIIEIILISSITGIVVMIPVSLHGLGVRESLAVLLYGQVGADPKVTLSAFLILIFIRYLTAGIVLSYLTNKLKWQRIQSIIKQLRNI